MQKIMPLLAVVFVNFPFMASAMADNRNTEDVDAAILEALAAIDRAEDAIKAPNTVKNADDVKMPARGGDMKTSDKPESALNAIPERKRTEVGETVKDQVIYKENAVLLSSIVLNDATDNRQMPRKVAPAVAEQRAHAKVNAAEALRDKSVDNAKPEKMPPKKRIPESKELKSQNFNASASLAFVSEIYRLNGVDFQKKISKNDLRIVDLFQYAYDHKLVYRNTKPAVGDLAFFHNTYDRNGDGRRNDWYSTVGIVESVEDNGNIFVLVYASDRIARIVMNLKHPQTLSSDNINKAQNSILRPDGAASAGSASKLFAGFGNLLKDKSRIIVVDNWHPGMRLELK